MNSPIHSRFPIARGSAIDASPFLKRALVAFLVIGSCPLMARAQEPAGPPDPKDATIQLLLQRIDKLEARVSQLEAAKAPAPAAVTPAPTSMSATAQTTPTTETEQPSVEHAEPERMDMSKTLLRIRGFGDVNLHGGDQKGQTTTFALGQLDLFVTSDISDRFKFLGEIVFEGGPDNIYGAKIGETNEFNVDVERYLIQYSQNDYFNISAGRYHTAIGYYNTAYHHSTWLQTTTGRPLLFEFEDQGGLLPIHNVGVSVNGMIPSGGLGLHYVAEIGNGRATRSPLDDEPVQNEIDENNHKAFNLALFARPEAVQGLQVGFSAYRDLLTPTATGRVGETILDAYAVLVRPTFEFLNEALVIRHAVEGSQRVYNTGGFYTQISKRFSDYRPYFRYQYVNASDNEPIFPDIGLRHGPSIGLRYDASESVALKLQYDRMFTRAQPASNGLTLQAGFTF